MSTILHLIGSRKSGGAERFFGRLVSALDDLGTPSYAVTPPGSDVLAELSPRVGRAEIPMRGIWDLSARMRIGKLIKRLRPQIVQTWMGRATRLTHIPTGADSIHIARLGGYYDLKGYRHAHAWLGNTKGIRDYLVREGLPVDRVFYIGNFIDPAPSVPTAQLQALRVQLEVPEDAWIVLTVARLHPNKGVSDLLQAVARMPAEIGGRPIVFVIVGDGPLRQRLLEEARRLGVTSRVRWPGWQAEPAAYYRLADLFVCPSRHEPLGNVVLEAWCYATPVLATRSDGPTELIRDTQDGLLVPCADAAALADAMRDVLSQPEQVRKELSRAGLQTLEREHSRGAVTAAYQALYARLSGAL